MDRDINMNPDPGFGGEAAGSGGLGNTGGFGGSSQLDGQDEGMREKASEAVERGKERMHDAADRGREKVASSAERLGDKLHDRAREMEERGGMGGRVAPGLHRAGEGVEDAAEYVRSHDLSEVRDDVKEQIRTHPLMSVGIALGAGYILGRILD